MIKFTTEDAQLHTAAVRAGIRTGAQTAGSAIVVGGGIGQAATWGELGAQAIALGITVGGALLAGAGAGVAAYLSFIGKGVPAEYQAGH